jgi:hypothetical protein
VATIENGDPYPKLTIWSQKSIDGGMTKDTNYERAYTVDIQASFIKWP